VVPPRRLRFPARHAGAAVLVLALAITSLRATPANKSALEKHYDRFLSREL
jgi:hypothetical protein